MFWSLLEILTPLILLLVKTPLEFVGTIGSTCMEGPMKKIMIILKNSLGSRDIRCANSTNSKSFKYFLQINLSDLIKWQQLLIQKNMNRHKRQKNKKPWILKKIMHFNKICKSSMFSKIQKDNHKNRKMPFLEKV